MLATPAAAAEPARIDALDGVRGLAILLVVLFHALFFGVPVPGVPFPADSVYVRFASFGWCGVDVFFVLSGYLITGILLRSKAAPRYFRNFYARRALRIFPLYYLVIALLLFVLHRPPAAAADQASYLLYYQNLWLGLSGARELDGAREITWSLAIEEQFYLLWPAVVWLCSRRALARVCVAAIVGAIVLRAALAGVPDVRTHLLTPCRMDTLAAGALLATVGLPPRRWAAVALVLGAAGLVAAAAWTGTSLPEPRLADGTLDPRMQRWALPAALSFAVGVVALAARGGAFARACSIAPLRSLGAYSYCVYLVHFLVIDDLAHWLHARVAARPALQQWLAEHPPLALLLAFTAVCLAISWTIGLVSWHLFEKHFLALKRHFPSAGRPTAPLPPPP